MLEPKIVGAVDFIGRHPLGSPISPRFLWARAGIRLSSKPVMLFFFSVMWILLQGWTHDGE